MIGAAILLALAQGTEPILPTDQPVATAQDQPHAVSAETDAPQLLVTFDGGALGTDMAAFINRLSDLPDLLKVRTVALGPGDNPCVLFTKQGFPPDACTHLSGTFRRLNPSFPDDRALPVGASVRLPDVVIDRRIVSRTFDHEVADDRVSLKDLLRGWRSQVVRTIEKGGLRRVQYYAYDMRVSINDRAQLQRASDLVEPLRSRNVLISPAGSRGERSSAPFSADPAKYQSTCKPDTPAPSVFDYADLVEAEPDLLATIKTMPPPSAHPDVWVVDTPVAGLPSLAGAIASATALPTERWQCRWGAFKLGLHHGNHLAGIIAGRKGRGFAGLAGSAMIQQLPWMDPDPVDPEKVVPRKNRDLDLSALVSSVENNSVPGVRSIFLIATDFQTPYGAKASGGRLSDASIRSEYTPSAAIIRERPLVVVAAGQVPSGTLPNHIDILSTMAPQNLGDQEGVIVVTACERCGHNGTVLMDGVNVSGSSPSLIHLAAPGGAALPGWLDANTIGEARGTSQAAAFVAGVLGDMLSRYPQVFARASTAKTRIQATAWPLVEGVGHQLSAPGNVAVGVVDPWRAALDPTRDWVRIAGEWRAVRAKGWSSRSIAFVDRLGNDVLVQTDRILRIVRTSPPGEPASFAVLTAGPPGGMAGAPGEVQRLGPVRIPEGPDALETCGDPIALSDMEELIRSTVRRVPGVDPCR